METFVLVLILILPTGEAHDFVIDGGYTHEKCMEAGRKFEDYNGGGVAWECEAE